MKLPALLVSAELKRKIAKEKVKKSIENIKVFGIAAGFSDKTLLDFFSLAHLIERDIAKNECENKADVGRSPEKQALPANDPSFV